jgi:acetylornithine deacetylase/succinyl-diaminopimelate desuccinylase-like protein
MTRDAAIARAARHYDDGTFIRDLTGLVAYRSESQVPESRPQLRAYLQLAIGPMLVAMGYRVQLLDNPRGPDLPPFMVGTRKEDEALPTVLTYGHGDVIRGLEGQWAQGRDPWTLVQDGGRWYGRGSADNKGQHAINLAALACVIAERGKLGFNSIVLIETGEELGSPGLREFCELHKDKLRADILIGSDGPRLAPDRPTLYMGTRGALNFDMTVRFREGGHHSGNWGGLLANPAIVLANAIASIADARGRVAAREIMPDAIPNSVRAAVADLKISGGDDAPEIDPWWGEPGLTEGEKVFAWNTFEVLAMICGNPDRPVNAVPPWANAHCQIRFTADKHPDTFLPALRRFLDERGFQSVELKQARLELMKATRLLPDHPAVVWAAASVERTTGLLPVILPNLGGSLPNDCFADTLSLPTVWIPHSYAGCSQHAPNEHALESIMRQGLEIMAGVFWDMGEAPPDFAGFSS